MKPHFTYAEYKRYMDRVNLIRRRYHKVFIRWAWAFS